MIASSGRIVPVSYIASARRNEILRSAQDDRILQDDGILQDEAEEQKTARPFPSEMDLLLQNDNRLPDYPYAALQMKLEGIVIVQLDLSQEGEVLQATIAQSSGYEILDQAACTTLKIWKFQPETTTPLLQKIVFNLEGAVQKTPDQNKTRREAE